MRNRESPVGCISPDRTPEELLDLRGRLAQCADRFAGRADDFAVLASESRLKILSLLQCVGELCVCDLATILEISPAAVSQHLRRLRQARLVELRRDGTTTYHRTTESPQIAALRALLDPPADDESAGPPTWSRDVPGARADRR